MRAKIGAYFDGRTLSLLAYKPDKRGDSLIGSESVSATSIQQALQALTKLAETYKAARADVVFTIPTSFVSGDIKAIEESSQRKAALNGDGDYAGDQTPTAVKSVTSFQIIPAGAARRMITGSLEEQTVSEIRTYLAKSNFSSFTLEFSFISLLRIWHIPQPAVIVHIDQGDVMLAAFDEAPAFLYSVRSNFTQKKGLSISDIKHINGELRRVMIYYNSLPSGGLAKRVQVSGPFAETLVDKLDITLPAVPVPKKSDAAAIVDEVAYGAYLRTAATDLNFLSLAKTKKSIRWTRIIIALLALLVIAEAIYIVLRFL